jgi:hypothetical protein
MHAISEGRAVARAIGGDRVVNVETALAASPAQR